MESLEEIIATSLAWIKANPIVSGILALLIAAIGIYAKTAIQTVAKKHTESLMEPKDTEEETFDEPSGPILQNRTNEEDRRLTTEELIALYGDKNPPYSVEIGNTCWTFAATRTVSPAGYGALDDQNLSLLYRNEWFELDDEINWLTAHRLQALQNTDKSEQLFNGDPFRIINIKSHADEITIEVGRCKYFDSLRTNFSMDLVIPSKGQTLREVLHGTKGELEPLGESRLPNHMGLVIIVESSDGQIIVQARSTRVQLRPGTLSASVSGTFEKNDLTSASGKISLAHALVGVMREMHGELGGRYSEASDSLYFMGLMREFRRGGFPDFYFYHKSEFTFAQIEGNSRHAEESFEVEHLTGYFVGGQALLDDPEKEKDRFDARVDGLLRAIEGKANLTLSLGVALYYELMMRRAFGMRDSVPNASAKEY